MLAYPQSKPQMVLYVPELDKEISLKNMKKNKAIPVEVY
jgi:hypothetical protein